MNKKRRQSPTGLPQYLKSEIYASQTIQAFACGFTCTAQLRAGKLLFRGSESQNIHLQAGELAVGNWSIKSVSASVI